MSLTYDEIFDTFNALEKTRAYLDEKWGDIGAFVSGKSRFVFVGCGSSYSIAKSFAAICYMGAGKPATAIPAGDIILHAGRYRKVIGGAAVVFISRSGRTSELLMALDALKSQGCDFAVASVVCAGDTPLGAKSGLVLSTPWAFDESVCQTRCVTNFYFIAAYVFAKIASDPGMACGSEMACNTGADCDSETVCSVGTDCDSEMAYGTQLIGDLRQLLLEGDGYTARARTLAEEISALPWTHATVLADAELEGLAEEGSLVFKEVCQLPSNYHHLLDVRHGPMVLAGEQTLVLAMIGGSNKLENDLLGDMKKKGAQVVAFCGGTGTSGGLGELGEPEELGESGELGELGGLCELGSVRLTGFGRPLSHIAAGIPFLILCQLIAYYKSRLTGADPDKPEGLDPWIAL